MQDGYGSTEGGATVQRVPDTPKGSLGLGPEGTVILDPETGEECPRAEFDAQGRLLNPLEAIGEIVNKNGAAGFEGYYKNDEANEARVRDGYYWTGDLGYRDEQGYFYFAGRDFEWLRVDGENFAAAPIERLVMRHPDVVLACVYAVPDEEVGDQVMVTDRATAGRDVRARGLRRVPDRTARPRDQVVAALRPGRREDADDREPEGEEAGAASRALGPGRRRLLAAGEERAAPAHDRRGP